MSRKSKIRIGVHGTLGLVLLLLMLHPYARQAVFGPRIRGMPFAYWQDRFRESAVPSGHTSPLAGKFLALLRIRPGHASPVWDHDAELLPIVLSLVDDPHERVRAGVADSLARHPESDEACDTLLQLTEDGSATVREHALAGLTSVGPQYPPALPRLRELMRDSAPRCQVQAAYGVCRLADQADKDAIAILRSALGKQDYATHTSISVYTSRLVAKLGKNDPDLLRVFMECLPAEPNGRSAALLALSDAGPAAIPVLVELMENSDLQTRGSAVAMLGFLGRDAAEAIPALLAAREKNDDPGFDWTIAHALSRINPAHFPAPVDPPRPKAK